MGKLFGTDGIRGIVGENLTADLAFRVGQAVTKVLFEEKGAKPLLTIGPDGKLSLSGVARGRKKGLKQLAEYFAKRVDDDGPIKYVVIGNADCPKDAERLKDALSKIDDSILFLESSIGPVIGSHVGPGMIAVVFWGDDKREQLSVADRIARRVKQG